MKKFIAVAFSHAILCTSGACTVPTQDAVASGGVSRVAALGNRFENEADLDDFFNQFSRDIADVNKMSPSLLEEVTKLRAKVAALGTKVSKLKDEIDKLGRVDTPEGVNGCQPKYCELFQASTDMQKLFNSFEGSVCKSTRVKVWDYIDSVENLTGFLPRSADGKRFYSDGCQKKFELLNQAIKSLKEKIKGLKKIVDDELAKGIRVLSPRLTSDEIAAARCLCEQISGLSRERMDECISKSKKNMERFCGSTAGCNRLFLGHMPRSKSFEAVLNIVGYPIFVLGIRSFIGDLLSVYERSGRNHATIRNAPNMLSLIYCGETRYVKQVPPPVPSATSGSSSSSSSSQQTDNTPTNSPLFPQSSSSSGCPQTSPTIALPFTPAVSQGDSPSQQLDNSAVSLSSKTDSSIESLPPLTSKSFPAEYKTDPSDW